VAVIDYQANLALLKPGQPEFLADARPLELDSGAAVGDRAQIIQLEPNGTIATTGATLTTVTLTNYPIDDLSLLTFRLSAPLQQRDGSFVLPALRNGRLLGLLMRYDARSQTADLIPPPVIAHFLKDAAQPKYAGFARAGISYANLRDPQLRRYLGLKENGGVFVDGIAAGSPADQAGIQTGDVILSVENVEIRNENHLINLISSLPIGQRIRMHVWRERTTLTLDATVGDWAKAQGKFKTE